MDSNNSKFNFRNFFSNPTEAKWPDIPFTPTNVLSISDFTSKPLPKVDLELKSDPPKKFESKPKAITKGKKKMKNLHVLNSERMFDTPLAGLVKTVEADKKLDSDSSANAICDSNISNNKINYSRMKNNFQFYDNIPKDMNSTDYYYKTFPGSNYVNIQRNNASVNPHNDYKYPHSYVTPPSISLLKEARSSTYTIPNSNMLPISTVPINPIAKNKIATLHQNCFAYDSQMPLPNSSQNKKDKSTPLLNQSIYASMGLDEDLCDIKTSKTVEKSDSYHTSNKQEVPESNNKTMSSFNKFANATIKIENITPPTSPGKVKNNFNGNSSMSTNEMHVSMTFEADDELDDIPLSFLKDRVTDKNSPEAENDNKNAISTSNNNLIGIPFLIKKESIQDEIAWEGPEIFSQNVSTMCPNGNTNITSNSRLDAIKDIKDLHASLVPVAVKIKTEPNTEFDFSKSTLEMPCSENLEICMSKTAAKGQTNMKNKMVFNELDSVNFKLPTVNSVGDNLPKLCDSNISKSSVIVQTKSNNCVISAKDNLFSDALLSHSDIKQADFPTIHKPSLDSCISSVETNIQEKGENQNKIKFDTNNENFSVTSEQLSDVSEIIKSYLVGDSDISSESISPKKKSKKRKGTKIAAEICNEFSAENTEYIQKCNMDEVAKESVKVDENLPITLLIKRKKTNLYNSDTFLYTSFKKSEIKDTCENSLLTENASQSSILNINTEENLSGKDDFSLSNFETSNQKKVVVRKKKKTPKKSSARRQKNSTLNNINKNEPFSNPEDNVADNLEMNAISTKKSELSYKNTPINCSKEGHSVEPMKKNGDTFVYMSFEEQNSPINGSDDECIQSVLSCKKENSVLYSTNIDTTNASMMKIENKNDILSEVKSKNIDQSKSLITKEQCSTSTCEISSVAINTNNQQLLNNKVIPKLIDSLEISCDLESVMTNGNIQQLPNDQVIPKPIDSNSISKKKKKRSRTFGWSKKKKKCKNIPISNLSTNTSSVSVSEVIPVPEIKEDAPIQTPVVIIKNIIPCNNEISFSDEQKISNDSLEKQDIIIPLIQKVKKTVCKKEKTGKSKQNKKIIESFNSENAEIENFQTSNSETSSILEESISVKLSPENDNIATAVSSLTCKEPEVDITVLDIINKDKNCENINPPNMPIKPFYNSSQKNFKNFLTTPNNFIQDEQNSKNCLKSICQNNLSKTFKDVMSTDKNTGNILSVSNLPDIKSEPSNSVNGSMQLILNKIDNRDDCQIIESLNQCKSSNTAFDNFNTASSVDHFKSNATLVVNNSLCVELTSVKHEVPNDNIHKVLKSVDDTCSNMGYNSHSTNHSILSNNLSASVPHSLDINNTRAVADNLQFNGWEDLSIKKEFNDKVQKAGSYQPSSLNAIRDDLIEKHATIHSNSSPNIVLTSLKDFSNEKQNIKSGTAVQDSNVGNFTDDEIQVLEVKKDVPGNVTVVDLTDDHTDVLISNELSDKKNSILTPQLIRSINYEIHTENSKGVILTPDISVKENAVFNQNNQRFIQARHNSISPSVSERDSVSPLLNNKIYDIPQSTAYSLPSDNKIDDPLDFKHKYKHEYLKYPYPCSVLTHSSNQRNKHKIYTRISSQSLNLSIEKVEARLKNSENANPQFGNKLGDIVKLKKYPVSISEVECYHRILGVAPSHKLLSKCFKPSDKTSNAILKDDFTVSDFQAPLSAHKDRSNQKSSLLGSLNDILGISNIKNTKPNSDFHTIAEVYDRDCPSTNTIDSCDSYVSNLSDRFVRTLEKKDDGNILKENEHFSDCTDTSVSDRNSLLSCVTTDFQDKSSLENITFNTKKSLGGFCSKNFDFKTSQNILSYLSLPSKEMLDSIVNNTESNRLFSNSETLNTNANKILPVSENDISLYKESLSYDSNTPSISVTSLSSGTALNTDIKSNIIQNSNNSFLSDVVLPVTELRKILEVARSVSSDENNSDSNSWKNKSTYEYNHIQSTPVEQTNSNSNDLENVLNSSNVPFTSTHVESKTSTDITEEHSFDDNDNEPSYYESDFDGNETSESKNEEKEVPKIPQYKTRWEKIMERKSLENNKIEQINEHALKDCFALSNLSSRKHVFHETRTKTNKKSKKSKKESSMKCDMKLINSERKSSERKSKKNKMKSKISVTYYSKSKDTKKVSTKLTIKKNKGKKTHIDDASNLFIPDKPSKSSSEKKKINSNEKKQSTMKSNSTNPTKCFYGNRVTNRGTFLTNIATSEILKKIKIPKKKIPEVPKKPPNIRSEEFHSMVKSPEINIDTRFVPSYKIRNKSNNYNKNKREAFYNRSLNTHSSKSTYFPKKDKRSSYAETRSSGFSHTTFEENMQSKKIPLLPSPPSLSHHLNDESILSRKPYTLHPSKPLHSDNQSVPLRVNYKNSHLANSSSTSFHQRNESFPNSHIPVLGTGTHPCNSFQFSSISTFQTDQTLPTAILRNIISSAQSAQLNNSAVKNNIHSFSDYLNPIWNKAQLSASSYSFREQPTFSDQSDSMSDSFSTNVSGISDIPSISEHLVPQFSFQNFDAAFKVKGLHNIPLNSSPISDEVPKKAMCLVPQHLKTLVGNEIIDTMNVRLLILEWSVDWLLQQKNNQDPPPISNGLKKVVSTYDSFEDYYNTYFPLMLLDTWHRIYVSWTHLNQSSPYFCEITSYSVKSTFVSVECQTIFNKAAHPKGVFPDEGSILMVKYGYKCKNYSIRILGYVTNVKTRHFNPVTDSKLSSYKPPKDGNYDVLQVLTLTFMGAYNSEDIDKRTPIRIHVLCNVKSTLKQNDALLYINKSPLRAIILNPVEDGLLNVSLTSCNSPQDKVNECVRNITKGIVSTHPLPLLTIVKAMPESDRLNIIPLLIKNMKSTYKTKVLLCVRTIKTLGDIAANICLHDSLKLVIINKRCDTNVQFQRYLIDELVTEEMNKVGDQSIMNRTHLKNEAIIRTKKQIFSNCDVILSLIRNCHDEFMETTFAETESIAQMCCIVDEANLCTEPETLIPILHGVSKLILIGDPEYTAKVLSETAKEFDYHRSFFLRAYDLDSLTE